MNNINNNNINKNNKQIIFKIHIQFIYISTATPAKEGTNDKK